MKGGGMFFRRSLTRSPRLDDEDVRKAALVFDRYKEFKPGEMRYNPRDYEYKNIEGFIAATGSDVPEGKRAEYEKTLHDLRLEPC